MQNSCCRLQLLKPETFFKKIFTKFNQLLASLKIAVANSRYSTFETSVLALLMSIILILNLASPSLLITTVSVVNAVENVRLCYQSGK